MRPGIHTFVRRLGSVPVALGMDISPGGRGLPVVLGIQISPGGPGLPLVCGMYISSGTRGLAVVSAMYISPGGRRLPVVLAAHILAGGQGLPAVLCMHFSAGGRRDYLSYWPHTCRQAGGNYPVHCAHCSYIKVTLKPRYSHPQGGAEDAGPQEKQ